MVNWILINGLLIISSNLELDCLSLLLVIILNQTKLTKIIYVFAVSVFFISNKII